MATVDHIIQVSVGQTAIEVFKPSVVDSNSLATQLSQLLLVLFLVFLVGSESLGKVLLGLSGHEFEV